MSKAFSYADAVKLLGAKESGLVAALDRILGGALLSGATLGISGLLSWFDAKTDFIRLSHELLVKAAEKRSGLSRYNQTERVQAAHAVLVVVAFFEAVDELKLAIPVRELELDRNRQMLILGLADLFGGYWPLPSPSWPYENCRDELKRRYDKSAGELLALIKGHASWDELNETQQDHLARLLGTVGAIAIRRYEELWGRVAGAYPELRFWVQLRDGMATRAALARLETTLQSLVVGNGPDPRRIELARKYRAVLDRPIVDPDEVLPGLQVPPMGQAYVDPDFQVVPFVGDTYPAALAWWRRVLVRSDLYRYLVGYLTSPKAVSTPLLVLGDPGSGKSMLTRVLAARLPASDFLTVRVELRNTPTEADLVDQIQHGLRGALQEDISWADLARSAGDALPVVLLDGFDELLQATGVSQTRYLAKVAQFQRDRAETGHPVAVVVTSRISVCGGVHIPLGADVLRLVPFNDTHVTSWLESWNAANAAYFAKADLAPLAPSVALRYRDLAAQPLLLLMLALYDAGSNALQRVHGRIGEADLYERLLSMFARREVSKEDTNRTAADLDEDIETELERLSVVAFAMFNRGTQWVTEADLNADLAGLLDVEHSDRRPGMHTPLSPGEAVLGRFFFVQRSEALRDAHTLRTYEFLHATFGEFLVARFTLRVLYDLLRVEASRPRRLASSPVDDGELFALLSFTPLTSRRPVIDFLMELTGSNAERSRYADLVRRLFAVAQEGHPRSRMAYEPVALPVPARHATYSVNLVLLAIVLTGDIEGTSLGIREWSRLAGFWKSQLPAGEWDTFIRTVNVAWIPYDVSLTITDKVVVPLLRYAFPSVPPVGVTFNPRLESHFTKDLVSNYLRYPFESMLTGRFQPGYAKALIDLGVARNRGVLREQWYVAAVLAFPDLVLEQLRADLSVPAKVLERLAETPLRGSGDFWAQLFDRIGRSGPDHDLLELVGRHWPERGSASVLMSRPASMLDAWLRLHERGFEFPSDRRYPDTATLLTRLDLNAISAIRPDLGVRAERAVADLGVIDDALDNSPSTGWFAVDPELDPERTQPLRGADINQPVIPPPPVAEADWVPVEDTWQDQLRRLDEDLAGGRISADEYRVRRTLILTSAVSPSPPPEA